MSKEIISNHSQMFIESGEFIRIYQPIIKLIIINLINYYNIF